MASAQSFPNGAVSTVITNWNKTLDTMNSFNQITGIFTAPISGQYQVHATHTLLVSTGQSAGTMDEIQLGVNATPQYQDSRFYTKDVASASAFESLAQINTIVQLNAGETLYFSRRHTYSAAFNGTTQASTNTLAISYINPNF
jgi:hypothetical protein